MFPVKIKNRKGGNMHGGKRRNIYHDNKRIRQI